jgi:hypothetical protein
MARVLSTCVEKKSLKMEDSVNAASVVVVVDDEEEGVAVVADSSAVAAFCSRLYETV